MWRSFLSKKRELKTLQDRVGQLEERIGHLTETVASARPLLDDSRHLEDLAERAGQLSAAADTALLGLRERATAAGVGLPRVRPAFGTLHRAEVTGYVSLYFNGGRTDKIKLLVGWDDPPTDCICEANTTNDLNAYAGGIVRQNEYWTVVSNHGGRSGFNCVFTPLF
jgi:hypothetical protein